MTPEEQDRLEMLRAGPCVPPAYLKEYHGLEWPMGEPANRDFHLQIKSRPVRVTCGDGRVSRYLVESFLQINRVTTTKLMAVELGMTEDSLNLLLPLLPEIGLSRNYWSYPSLISESLRSDLTQNLRALRFRVFSEHEPFPKHLHDALREAVGIDIVPLYCATSLDLGEVPTRYADTFDSITLDPLSIAHQVWLDFGKPISLPPDRCSKLYYADNQEARFGSVVGWREPDDPSRYQRQTSGHSDV